MFTTILERHALHQNNKKTEVLGQENKRDIANKLEIWHGTIEKYTEDNLIKQQHSTCFTFLHTQGEVAVHSARACLKTYSSPEFNMSRGLSGSSSCRKQPVGQVCMS